MKRYSLLINTYCMKFLFKTLLLILIIVPSFSFGSVFEKAQSNQKKIKTEYLYGELILDVTASNLVKRGVELKVKRDQLQTSLVRVLEPSNLKGYVLLSQSSQTGARKQWLYSPSNNKTKRLVGSMQTARFLGSEFRYEDFLPLYQSQKVVLLKSESTPQVSVYKVGLQDTYSKVWIDAHKLVVVKVDVYEKALLKRQLEFLNFKKVNGFWRPFLLKAKNSLTNKESHLILSQVKLNQPISTKDMQPQGLSR